MQRIRPAVEILRTEIGLEYALASKRLYTDGAEVVYDFAKNASERITDWEGADEWPMFHGNTSCVRGIFLLADGMAGSIISQGP